MNLSRNKRRIVTACLAMLLAGCAGDDTQTATRVTQAPVTEASTVSPPRDAELRRYLAEGFAETSWYPKIVEVESQGSGVLVIDTSLNADSDTSALTAADALCRASTAFMSDKPAVAAVHIKGVEGQGLATRQRGGRCGKGLALQ